MVTTAFILWTVKYLENFGKDRNLEFLVKNLLDINSFSYIFAICKNIYIENLDQIENPKQFQVHFQRHFNAI